ncbi:MAG: hypothetical protein ACYC61_29185, partial [Isosphaeraceae bacterium]
MKESIWRTDLARVLDSSLSSIGAETDKFLRRGGPEPVVHHLDFFLCAHTTPCRLDRSDIGPE